MKIVEQKFALSAEDLSYLNGTTAIQKMLQQRLVVEFDTAPDLDNLDFSSCNSFYHIKSLGSKLFQFWFHDIRDYEDFRANIIAYKMSLTTTNDK
jgi:hypothetical protein